MSKICNSVLDLYQVSPLIRLNAVPKLYGIKCDIIAKCDFYSGLYGAKQNGFQLADTANWCDDKENRLSWIKKVSDQCEGRLDVLVKVQRRSEEQIGAKKHFPTKVDIVLLEDDQETGKKRVRSEKTIKISEKEAVEMVTKIVTKEAILCGIASASALAAAFKVVKEYSEEKRCVVFFEDGLLPTGLNLPVDKSAVVVADKLDIVSKTAVAKRGVSWNWYDDMAVSHMISSGLITVSEDDKLGFTVKLMKREKVHQLPVVSSMGGLFLGVVTSSDIMQQIVDETVTMESRVEKVMVSKFPRLEITDDLSLLIHLLDQHAFVAVVRKLDVLDGAEMAQMLVTPIDILNFYRTVVTRCGR